MVRFVTSKPIDIRFLYAQQNNSNLVSSILHLHSVSVIKLNSHKQIVWCLQLFITKFERAFIYIDSIDLPYNGEKTLWASSLCVINGEYISSNSQTR